MNNDVIHKTLAVNLHTLTCGPRPMPPRTFITFPFLLLSPPPPIMKKKPVKYNSNENTHKAKK